jgi:glutathione S-transferase
MEKGLKIFSYLPNPRVWKAEIAAKIAGITVEVIGDKPSEIPNWLWDANPKKLSDLEKKELKRFERIGKRGFSSALYKTDDFIKLIPFGTVPAAFSPDGKVGIFESNSILRAVARQDETNHLYGKNLFEASRIDSFLDSGLVFSREHQEYLFGLKSMNDSLFDRMKSAYEFFLNGIEESLKNTSHIGFDYLTIVDISFFCDFSQFLREGHYEKDLEEKGYSLVSKNFIENYPKTLSHLMKLAKKKEFSTTIGTYLDWYKNKLQNSS